MQVEMGLRNATYNPLTKANAFLTRHLILTWPLSLMTALPLLRIR